MICKLEEMRQAQSGCHTNRNKVVNAFARLLTGEIEDNSEFRKKILSDEDESAAEDAMDVDMEEQ